MVDDPGRIPGHTRVVRPMAGMHGLYAQHADALRRLCDQNAIVGHQASHSRRGIRSRCPVQLQGSVALVHCARGRDHVIHVDGFLTEIKGYDLRWN